MVKREELERKIKEKILLMGETGVGKTYQAVKIAELVASRGEKVVYIDPEYGAERELELLKDEVLDFIDLRVTPTWKEFELAVLQNDNCFLKIVDSLSDGFELAIRWLTDEYIRYGSYVIGDKEIPIKHRDVFVLPFQAYPKVYDGIRALCRKLVEHPYHLICTMHPLVRTTKEGETASTDARLRLEEDIFRKFDTIIRLETYVDKDKVRRYDAYLRKHRGGKFESLTKLFERRLK